MTIDQSYLSQRFTYDRETGLLYWLPLENDEYGWNRRFAGKVAGCVKTTGYRHIALDGKWYQAHRLIWMLIYGEWPNKVDHLNGDKSDNRIENMRSVSDAINAKNKPLSCGGLAFYARLLRVSTTCSYCDAGLPRILARSSATLQSHIPARTISPASRSWAAARRCNAMLISGDMPL